MSFRPDGTVGIRPPLLLADTITLFKQGWAGVDYAHQIEWDKRSCKGRRPWLDASGWRRLVSQLNYLYKTPLSHCPHLIWKYSAGYEFERLIRVNMRIWFMFSSRCVATYGSGAGDDVNIDVHTLRLDEIHYGLIYYYIHTTYRRICQGFMNLFILC